MTLTTVSAEKVPAITQQNLDDLKHLKKQADIINEEIVKRIDYILNVLFECFGYKIDRWFFEDVDEGESGSFLEYYDEDFIGGIIVIKHIKNKNAQKIAFIDKDGKVFNWLSQIPTRWIFEDDFEQEIINGKLLFEIKKQERRNNEIEKRKTDKEYDKKLFELAKSKLTTEEFTALMMRNKK